MFTTAPSVTEHTSGDQFACSLNLLVYVTVNKNTWARHFKQQARTVLPWSLKNKPRNSDPFFD